MIELRVFDAWYFKGDSALPEPFSHPPCPAIGLTNNGNLLEWKSISGFDEAYEGGAVIALFMPEGINNTTGYTIGKRSDFVKHDLKGFLDTMNRLESGWGGGSTIGGAPRNPDGSRSSLSVGTVKEIFMNLSS